MSSFFELPDMHLSADGPLADAFYIFLWLLLVWACISYFAGLISTQQTAEAILGFAIKHAATAQSSSSASWPRPIAGDRKQPPTPQVPGSWPVPRTMTSGAGTAPSSRKPWAWEGKPKPLPSVKPMAWQFSRAELDEGVDWATSGRYKADIRSFGARDRRDATARSSKQVRFAETVTEIAAAPPTPEPAAGQNARQGLQALLARPDVWFFAPGSVGPYGGVSGLSIAEMPAFAPAPGFGLVPAYEPEQPASMQHPEQTFTGVAAAPSFGTTAPLVGAQQPAQPNVSDGGYDLVARLRNAGLIPSSGPTPTASSGGDAAPPAAAPAPIPSTPNAAAATTGCPAAIAQANSLLSIIDKNITPILRRKADTDSTTAWDEATRSETGRTRLAQVTNALKNVHKLAVVEGGSVLDESKVSRAEWRARGWDTIIASLMSELDIAKLVVHARVPSAAVNNLWNATYKLEALFT